MEDSVKFCSNCGTSIDSDSSESSNICVSCNNLNFMERIEIVPLGIGLIFCIAPHIIGLLFPHPVIAILLFVGFAVGSFLVGYLSEESISMVFFYAILITVITWLVYQIFLSNGFFYLINILLPLVTTIVFSFIGNLIRVKLKT